MGKLKLKKAGKVIRRAAREAVEVAGGVAKIAEAIVVVAGLLEKAERAAARRQASPSPPPSTPASEQARPEQ